MVVSMFLFAQFGSWFNSLPTGSLYSSVSVIGRIPYTNFKSKYFSWCRVIELSSIDQLNLYASEVDIED